MESDEAPLDPHDIFNDALLLPVSERAAFLDRACRGDAAQRRLLDEMLEIAARDPSLLRPPDDGPLERLGKYEIRRECGRGGMGIVFEALDTTLGRRVALKLLPDRLTANTEARQRFEREARVLAALDHESIATIHTLDCHDGKHFFTMEYVDGEPLSDILKHGPLPASAVASLAAQVARALEYAHAQKIVHRDLKPANVMRLADGRIKLVDFGIAKMLEAESAESPSTPVPSGEHSSLRGTPGYMSPEQLLGGPTDPRIDVWAFGCILYECLTGRSVVDAMSSQPRRKPEAVDVDPPATRLEVDAQTRVDADASATPVDLGAPATLAAVPPEYRDLLRACLQTDPSRRPASGGDIRRMLEATRRRAAASRQRTAVAIAIAVVIGAGLWAAHVFGTRPRLATVAVDANGTLRAQDAAGAELWRRHFDGLSANDSKLQAGATPTIVRRDGRPEAIVVVTHATASPGTLWLLRAKNGTTLWSRPVAWRAPVNAQGNPNYRWNAVFDADDGPILVVGLFDGIWYSAAVQFLTMDNRLLAEYDHPGRLWPAGIVTSAADGQRRLLLYGDNSSGRYAKELVPFETREHCGCVALVPLGGVDGQAFPYSEAIPAGRDWPGVAHAVESAYLLIPVLGPDADASVIGAQIVRNADSTLTIQAQTGDGRVVDIDPDLGPKSCYVGTRSRAEGFLLGRTSERMLWIRRGERQVVDVALTF